MFAVDAEACRRVALGVEIDDQHAFADRRQRRAEVDRGSRLSDAALLIRHDEDARQRGVRASGLGASIGGLSIQANSEDGGLGVDRARKDFDRVRRVEVQRLKLILARIALGETLPPLPAPTISWPI